MCGRFVATTPPSVVAAHFDAAPLERAAFGPSFNVAPTDPILAVVTDRDGARRVDCLRWGLIPSWTRPPARPGALPSGAGMINARAETITTKAAFRRAFTRRRCLVPADGFYEWQRSADGTKQPWYIRRRDGSPLALAGIWETWHPPAPGSAPVRTGAIITTTANGLMAGVHDRMPVILEAADFDAWLDPHHDGDDALVTLLRPAADATLVRHPVSSGVNRVANNDPILIAVQEPGAGRPQSPERAVPLTLL